VSFEEKICEAKVPPQLMVEDTHRTHLDLPDWPEGGREHSRALSPTSTHARTHARARTLSLSLSLYWSLSASFSISSCQWHHFECNIANVSVQWPYKI